MLLILIFLCVDICSGAIGGITAGVIYSFNPDFFVCLYSGTIGGITAGVVMLLLVVVVVVAIVVVGLIQRRQAKVVILEESPLDNEKYRDMIQESLLKEEVLIIYCVCSLWCIRALFSAFFSVSMGKSFFFCIWNPSHQNVYST